MKGLKHSIAGSVIAVAAALLLVGNSNGGDGDSSQAPLPANTAVATFAGGCFWCVESDFDGVPGVLATISGYTGGSADKPTYKNHMRTGHREAVQISYDPDKVSYDELLRVFWRSVDPTDPRGQFCDRGHSYTTAVYAHDESQIKSAELSKMQASEDLAKPVVTEIIAAEAFWPAEDYHQDYYLKNPVRYKFYRASCGRDKRIRNLWGDAAHEGIARH